MDDPLELWQQPVAEEIVMIAGWRQWADAGSISSGLPQYLIDHTNARKIGQIKPDEFYLFQVPGTHHLLRPVVKFKDGHRQSLEAKKNELFYVGDEEKGLVLFLGDEPHMNVEQYAEAFFAAVASLKVSRVAMLGGVYGAMPYDKDRDVSGVYSLPQMKDELASYAVRFSDYEGGATIGSYLLGRAQAEGVESFAMYAFVPAYDFAQPSLLPQGMRIENDFKAWHELMRRLNHMFKLGLDLSDLERQSKELVTLMDAKIDELDRKMPQLNAREYIEELDTEFTELSFVPLDDVWERELGDLFRDSDDQS
jgi:proteasome assembly chaperone (PAC2) family protein